MSVAVTVYVSGPPEMTATMFKRDWIVITELEHGGKSSTIRPIERIFRRS